MLPTLAAVNIPARGNGADLGRRRLLNVPTAAATASDVTANRPSEVPVF